VRSSSPLPWLASGRRSRPGKLCFYSYHRRIGSFFDAPKVSAGRAGVQKGVSNLGFVLFQKQAVLAQDERPRSRAGACLDRYPVLSVVVTVTSIMASRKAYWCWRDRTGVRQDGQTVIPRFMNPTRNADGSETSMRSPWWSLIQTACQIRLSYPLMLQQLWHTPRVTGRPDARQIVYPSISCASPIARSRRRIGGVSHRP